MKFGLSENDIDQIKSVFGKHKEIEKVIIYGSRAKGNFHPSSDIDLTLIGPNLSLSLQLHIENELDDLLLPYKFDISIFHQISNPDLIAHIERVGIKFLDNGTQ
ncbi:MAG: nucleotidyltransferase domain-containing protein [Bacteroidota bacterium]|nr:nucleotidyltransferase domain-containing protein [Bacteroidota bacterium]